MFLLNASRMNPGHCFFGGALVRCCVVVMVKCSEPIVVAHSGPAAKQYPGTRGHPATVTDKTALVLGWGGGGAVQAC